MPHNFPQTLHALVVNYQAISGGFGNFRILPPLMLVTQFLVKVFF